jgi:hypothetical protein
MARCSRYRDAFSLTSVRSRAYGVEAGGLVRAFHLGLGRDDQLGAVHELSKRRHVGLPFRGQAMR